MDESLTTLTVSFTDWLLLNLCHLLWCCESGIKEISGGHTHQHTPDPIPNSMVKVVGADDSAARCESRSLQESYKNASVG